MGSAGPALLQKQAQRGVEGGMGCGMERGALRSQEYGWGWCSYQSLNCPL
jgi:hypothetical protein